MKAKPIGCNVCGYNNVPGREQIIQEKKIIKWVCPRCGQIARKETVNLPK